MKKIVDATQMKAIDEYTIEKIRIPSMVLMERAALHVASLIKKHTVNNSRILAVCGYGNNGGDGIACARILKSDGFSVDILMVGDETKATLQTKEQLTIARNLGLSINNKINISEYTIIIDAIFGIGLSKPVTGDYEAIITIINESGALVFSVDIPSGLSADLGKPYNVAIKADYTITFGLMKRGMLIFPGYLYAGEVHVVDIGFPEKAVEAVKLDYFTYDRTDLKQLPNRKAHSNKGTYGKVLIVAGSANIGGACFFSAKAAYRTGTGLVKIVTDINNKAVLQTLLPEALVTTYDSSSELEKSTIDQIVNEIKWATAIVFGPGVGVNSHSERLLELILKHAKTPLIIDADGINILVKRIGKTNTQLDPSSNPFSILELCKILPEQTIVTPHLLEFSRLIQEPLISIQEHLFHTIDSCTRNNNLVFVIKDDKTIVANENKRYINTAGNSGMATGGSGDVLTGIIAGLIAQGMSQFEAATLGVYIHGLAGDIAAKSKGQYGMLASDIMDSIADVLRKE